MTAINSNRAIRGPVTAVPVVAGKGVRLVADTDNNRWVVEADETVLWESTPSASSITLSETAEHFERIKVFYRINDLIYGSTESIVIGGYQKIGMSVGGNYGTQFIAKWGIYALDGTSLGPTQVKNAMEYNTASGGGTVSVQYENTNAFYIMKVIGINRIQGGA